MSLENNNFQMFPIGILRLLKVHEKYLVSLLKKKKYVYIYI